MSIILSSSDQRDHQVNVWNWGVLHHMVVQAGLFSEDDWGPKRSNGGGQLTEPQVAVLADFLECRLLPRLQIGERMFVNGSTTATPDDGTFYRAESELWKNYSLSRSVLVSIIEFLRTTKGPVSFF
jgi:hypothetical protein